jgi:hypothetical protein
MNHHAIQSACVLLHFGVPRDKAFAQLSTQERALFDSIDPRAFKTDPERRFRALTALLDEFPVSCAIVGVTALEQFFESQNFFDVVHKRVSMALAFGEWIDAGEIAKLELAIAKARRRRVAAVVVSAGTLEHWNVSRASVSAESIARGARIQRAQVTSENEHLLIEGDAISVVSDALCLLVEYAETPRTRAELVAKAKDLGAGDDADDVVDGLIRDGLIVG